MAKSTIYHIDEDTAEEMSRQGAVVSTGFELVVDKEGVLLAIMEWSVGPMQVRFAADADFFAEQAAAFQDVADKLAKEAEIRIHG